MKKERIKHLILLIVLIAIDQISKYFVRAKLMNNNPFDIIPGVLNLQYHENTGAVWGIMSGKVDFLRIFTFIILLVIIFVYFKIPDGKKFKILKVLAVFMIAGALGNMIDRFTLGHVTDFIYFEIIDFPLFNFADSCLTCSSFLLFFLALFYFKDDDFAFLETAFKKKKDNEESDNKTANSESEDDYEEDEFDEDEFDEDEFEEESDGSEQESEQDKAKK